MTRGSAPTQAGVHPTTLSWRTLSSTQSPCSGGVWSARSVHKGEAQWAMLALLRRIERVALHVDLTSRSPRGAAPSFSPVSSGVETRRPGLRAGLSSQRGPTGPARRVSPTMHPRTGRSASFAGRHAGPSFALRRGWNLACPSPRPAAPHRVGEVGLGGERGGAASGSPSWKQRSVVVVTGTRLHHEVLGEGNHARRGGAQTPRTTGWRGRP